MILNVGPLDSIVRIFVGIALLFSALMGYIGAWGFLGVVLIATGLGRTCPAYSVCRLNTNRSDEGSH
jgi:hypothetical protein